MPQRSPFADLFAPDTALPPAPQAPAPPVAPSAAAPATRPPQRMSPLLLALLPIAMAKGGREAVAGLLQGFSQSQQRGQEMDLRQDQFASTQAHQQAQEARATTQEARLAAQAEAAQQERQLRLKNELGQTAQTFETPEAFEKWVAFVGPQVQRFGIDLATLRGLSPSAQAMREKRIVTFLEKRKPEELDQWHQTRAALTIPKETQEVPYPEWAPLSGGATAGGKRVPSKAPEIPTAGSFEEYSTASPERKKQIEADRKAYFQADDRTLAPRRGSATATPLTPEGIQFWGTIARVTGKFPPLGVGASSARIAIADEAARQAKELQLTGADVVGSQAQITADQGSLRRLQLLASGVESFEGMAHKQADLVSQLSTRVRRSAMPLLNRAIIAGKRELAGDRDAQLLANAIITFTTEYAKIMTGSTNSAAASTDAARREAAELLSTALNEGTLQASLDQMKLEMRFRIESLNEALTVLRTRLSGREAPPQNPASASAKQKLLIR